MKIHPLRFVAHGRRVVSLATERGWRPGARYTNLRDIRHVAFEGVGFLDIRWKNYCFESHLGAARQTRPYVTVARDIERACDLDRILSEAEQLARYSTHVIVVPKDRRLEETLDQAVPTQFLLGYSVPTRYGGTSIAAAAFRRPVHLLGGRPDVQRKLANEMPVVSFDCNRFTLDARYGDYFDGQIFRPHPRGGYETCLIDSMSNIEALWANYATPAAMRS